MQALLDSLDEDLKYAIEVEGNMAVSDITNYAEARILSTAVLPHLLSFSSFVLSPLALVVT